MADQRQGPKHIALPATSDCAFWASLMLSWVAQASDGLLVIDQWALSLIGVASLVLGGLAVYFAIQQPWPNGSMKLSLGMAKIMFLVMIVLTATWIFIAIAHTRTPTAQVLYVLCAALSAWSAWAIFRCVWRAETADQRP